MGFPEQSLLEDDPFLFVGYGFLFLKVTIFWAILWECSSSFWCHNQKLGWHVEETTFSYRKHYDNMCQHSKLITIHKRIHPPKKNKRPCFWKFLCKTHGNSAAHSPPKRDMCFPKTIYNDPRGPPCISSQKKNPEDENTTKSTGFL